MSVDATPSFDNPEMATAVEAQFADKQQTERKELAEAQSDKREILETFDSETVDVRLKRWRITMETVDGDTETWLENVGVRFSDINEESELDKERQDDVIEAKDRMKRILAEHSVEDQYDYDFWSQIPRRYRQECLESLLTGGIAGERAGN